MNASTMTAKSSGLQGAKAGLAHLLVDNPVLLKDATLLLRRRMAAAAWLVVAVALLLVAGGSYLDGHEDVRQWGTLDPPGGNMLVVLTGLLLGVLTFLMPALASTTITSERESGTLPLLIVSGLTPARLVAGKIGALFTAAAPFLALTLPLFALCSLFLGADVGDVALAAVGVFVHALTLACVGVWASALAERMRSAVLIAQFAAGVPSLLGGLPLFIAVISVAEDRDRMLVVGIVGIAIELVIAGAAVVGAWSALAPRSSRRWPPARLVLVAGTLGVPLVGAACLMFASKLAEDAAVGVALQVIAVAVGVVSLAPSITGRRPHTPTPLKAALLTSILGLIGLGITYAALQSTMQRTDLFDDVDDVAALVAVFVAIAGVAAFAGRWLKSPVVSFLSTAGVFITLFAIPAVLDEFTFGDPPLAFLNLGYVVAHGSFSVWPTVLFYGALATVTFVCSRGPRRA